MSLPAAMFHPIQGAPAVVADNGGLLVCTRIIAIADGCSVGNAGSARAVVHVWRHCGEPAACRRRAVGAGHAGIDLDFGDLAAGCVRPAPGRDEAAPAQGTETQAFGVGGRGGSRRIQGNVGSRVGAGAVIETVQLRAGDGIQPADIQINPAGLRQRQFDRDRTRQLFNCWRRGILHSDLNQPRQRAAGYFCEVAEDPGRLVEVVQLDPVPVTLGVDSR